MKDYMSYGTHKHPLILKYCKTHVRGLAIVAVKEIKDGEELFLNYIDSSFFEINDNPPDWLIKPPSFSPYITKGSKINQGRMF
jgi:hypothetical protein